MTVLPCIFVCLLGMLPTAFADSNCKLDLGLVVDTTKSIKKENIPHLSEALKRLVQAFPVSEEGTHVSLETFAKTSTIHNYFKDTEYHNENAVKSLIASEIEKLTKITRIDLALQKANDEMFTEESGDRPGVRSVMVMFTDGRSHPRQTDVEKYITTTAELKSKGVRLVVVAIGPGAKKTKYRKVLNQIGGENVLHVDDYDELGGVVSDIVMLVCPPNSCEKSKGLDVAFVVDKTQSVGRENFRLVKGFLHELHDALTIGPDATHTAHILFEEFPEVINDFADSRYYSGEEVYQLIKNIPEGLGDKTFIDRALKAANDQLFTEEGGDRPDYPNVLILLTDGKTNEDSEPFGGIISSLKAKNVKIIAIGVGKHENFMEELKVIAGAHVYTAENFNQLSDLMNQILEDSCSEDPDKPRRTPHMQRHFKLRNPKFLFKLH